MIRWIWVSLFSCFVCYTLLIYTAGANNAGSPNESITAGMHTWQEKNCQSCHQLYGLGGYMGPDLTNVASEKGKGQDYMKSFIKYGTRKMPNLNLSNSEVDNLIAFLSWVDKSGRSKVFPESVHWTGTYKLSK